MNRKLLEIRDNLKGTLDAMTYVKTEEELYKLFACAIQELLDYELVLKNKLKK